MSLARALSSICPVSGVSPQDHGYNCSLMPNGESAIPCHHELLAARCPQLSVNIAQSAEVFEDSEVVYALLRWVYCETLVAELTDADKHEFACRVVKLAWKWGLRDAGCLQGKVADKRCRVRAVGTLAEDLLHAYDQNAINGRLTIQADGTVEASDIVIEEFPHVWSAVLRARSTYFHAMLGGSWAESNSNGTESAVVKLHWPPQQIGKLLRFLHGAEFVSTERDLRGAIDCADFFGVPSLLASINDWISQRLHLNSATRLWRFIENEPVLIHYLGVEGVAEWHNCSADADDACFDFHIKHFEQMAGEVHDQLPLQPRTPLHELSVSLFRRLLTSGLLDMATEELTDVVKRFVRAHVLDKDGHEYSDLVSSLCPPRVLFNREQRDRLLPVGEVTAWSVA